MAAASGADGASNHAGQLINEAVAIFFSNFSEQAALILVFMVPTCLTLAIPAFVNLQVIPMALTNLAMLIVLIMVFSLMAAAQTWIAIRHLRRWEVSVTGAIRKAAVVAVSVIVVALVESIGLVVGLVLLILPGLLLMSVLALTTAIIVDEGADAIQAMIRSVRITKGHRWQILFALVLINLIAVVPRFGVSVLEEHLGLVAVLFRVVLDMLFLGLQATAMAVFYERLRIVDDRGDVHGLTSVFD